MVDITKGIRLTKDFTPITLRITVVTSIRTIVQKFDSPIVDSIGQNNCPMRWCCDSLYGVLFQAAMFTKEQ